MNEICAYIPGNWIRNSSGLQMSVFAFQHLKFVISLDNKKNTKGAVPIISCEFKMYSTIVVDPNRFVSLHFVPRVHFSICLCVSCLLSFWCGNGFFCCCCCYCFFLSSHLRIHDYYCVIISFVCSRFRRVPLTFRKCEHLVRDNDINVVFLCALARTHTHIFAHRPQIDRRCFCLGHIIYTLHEL